MKPFEALFETKMGKGCAAIYTVVAIVYIAKAGYMFGHWLAWR